MKCKIHGTEMKMLLVSFYCPACDASKDEAAEDELSTQAEKQKLDQMAVALRTGNWAGSGALNQSAIANGTISQQNNAGLQNNPGLQQPYVTIQPGRSIGLTFAQQQRLDSWLLFLKSQGEQSDLMTSLMMLAPFGNFTITDKPYPHLSGLSGTNEVEVKYYGMHGKLHGVGQIYPTNVVDPHVAKKCAYQVILKYVIDHHEKVFP